MKRALLTLFAVLLYVPLTFASDATRAVTGKVTDSENRPIIGATIIVEGTYLGTTSDLDGVFTLNLAEGMNTLVVSSLGYTTQTISVGARSNIDVKLDVTAYGLDDVVVVGYGSMRRSDLTGSVSSVSSSALVNRKATTISEGMQGRLAGVQITTSDGAPGAAISMKIRGGTSINAGNSPLYVVDGMLIDGDGISYSDEGGISSTSNPIGDINANDIASIEVLKDASATAIYGSRGANGVILITTKQGESGRAKISYNGSFGVQRITNSQSMLNTTEFIDLMEDLSYISKENYYLTNPNPTSTNYQDEIYRTGTINDHQVSLTGGNKDIKYFTSLGYLRNDGIIINSMYRRFTGRVNVSGNIKPWLRFSTNNSVSNIGEQGLFQAKGAANAGVVTRSLLMRPDIEVWAESDTGEAEYGDSVNNPVLLALETNDFTDTWNIMSSSYLEATLARNLTLKVSLGVKSINGNRELYYPQTVAQGQSYNGLAINSYNKVVNILNENTLNYKFVKRRHSINAVAGVTAQSNQARSWIYRTSNFATDDLGSNGLQLGSKSDVPKSNKYIFSLMSYLARVNYTYFKRYMFTLSLRADGSSRFTDGNKWGYFPSAAFAWRASDETFIKNMGLFDNLKVRLSWGITGNQNTPNFSSQSIYNISSGYTFNGDNYAQSVIPSSNVGNPYLTWEQTAQYNAGVDIAVLRNRVQFTLDAYYKKTTDMLFYTELPPSSGVSTIIRNYGAVENKGVELSVNGVIYDTDDLRWSLDANISFNRNEVLSLGGNDYVYVDPSWNSSVINEAILMVGQPVGLWWGYRVDGVFQHNDPRLGSYSQQPNVTSSPTNTPMAGDYIYREVEVNGEVDESDKMVIGVSQPLFTGGFSTSVAYRNFDLNMQFSYSYGNDIFNANRGSTEIMSTMQNQTTAVLDRWQAPSLDNSGNAIPNTGNASTTMAAAGRVPLNSIISPWIEDGSYLRLQSLTLAYTLPERVCAKIGCSNVRLYLSGQNLLTLTGYSGYDPDVNTGQGGTGEIAPGLDYGAYPKSRTFSLGINLSL